MKDVLPTIQFLQDAQENMRLVENNGFKRWTVAKPLGITLWWRIRAAYQVLKGKCFSCHWE